MPVLVRLVLSVVLGSLLIGCGSSPPAPVEDRYSGSMPSSRMYQVQRGDTLYSIAFRYGLDFRRMAAANNIPAPYTIFPGQKLHLKEADIRRSAPPPVRTVAAAPAKAPAPKVAAKPTPVAKSSPSSSKKKTSATAYSGSAVGGWRWPTAGPVIRGYSGSVHKGIDIGGQRGDPVKAVATGKVVYAGTGIVGFGELLIVKHNELYLSAYGHNDRLLVSEGEVVQAGQKIAEKGSTGTDAVKLHFEIRKEGKPVDPRRLLPKR